jgi:hypothetical protein
MDMTAMKKAGTRFARWFKSLKDRNRPARRWYEHSIYNG